MANFVLDSYAVLAFFRNEKGADEIETLLGEALDKKHQLYLSVVNAGEVYYISKRKDGKDKTEKVWDALKKFPVHFINADLEISLAAAKIKADFKLSYSDAYAAALSIEKQAILLTGDPEFENLKTLKGFKVKFIG